MKTEHVYCVTDLFFKPCGRMIYDTLLITRCSLYFYENLKLFFDESFSFVQEITKFCLFFCLWINSLI